MSSHGLGVSVGSGELFGLRRLVGEVAIKEVRPERASRADLALACAVVRDVKAHAAIEHEVHVTVEVNRVSAMANDAMAVARLLIKPQAHSVQRRDDAELAGVHLVDGFGAQDLRILKLAMLEMGDH